VTGFAVDRQSNDGALMQNLRRIAVPAYLVAVLLVLFPVTDSALSVFPADPGQVSWRFGAVGLFSRALMTPLLGMLLLYAVAIISEHRRVLRSLAVVNALVTAVFAVIVPLFILDAIQLRSAVPAAAKVSFDVATSVALGKIVIAAVIATAFAVTGWKVSRKQKAAARQRDQSEAAGIMVGLRTI